MSSYIDAISQSTTASNAAGNTRPTDDQNSMGKEDFLTLLVAQLQNQDPLNPDDPTEFTAQLAQFSSLEQLFSLNDSMNNLVESNSNSDRLSTLSTIGKEVTYFGDTFKYKGDPVEIGYQVDGTATEITLSLQQNGATIATLKGTDRTDGNHFITWDGFTDSGKIAPVGDYNIVISAKAADGESVAVAPLIKSQVTGVDLAGKAGGLLVTQAGSVKFSEILGVFEPDTKLVTPTEDDNEDGTEKDLKSVEETLDTVASLTEDVTEIIE